MPPLTSIATKRYEASVQLTAVTLGNTALQFIRLSLCWLAVDSGTTCPAEAVGNSPNVGVDRKPVPSQS